MKLPLVKMQPAAITNACVIELDFVGTPICLEKEPWQNNASFMYVMICVCWSPELSSKIQAAKSFTLKLRGYEVITGFR